MEINKDYQDKKIEFCKNLHSKIFPKIEPFEKKRLQYFLIFIIVTLLDLFLILFLHFCVEINDFKAKAHLLTLLFSIPFIIYVFLQKQLESKINKTVMRQICKSFGSFKWSKGKLPGDDALYKLALIIPNYDRATHDDNFLGTYKDVDILIDEVNYEQKIRTKSGTSYVSVFRGLVISLKFNKNFSSHTVVKNNSLFHFSPSRNLKHTELEDVRFEKLFDVYTDDEIEARYILTPTFMDRLNNLKSSFKSSNITCSFFKNSLYIAISTNRDMFFMGSLVKSILNEKIYYKIFDEFYSVLNIIDVLKLNQKIGL